MMIWAEVEVEDLYFCRYEGDLGLFGSYGRNWKDGKEGIAVGCDYVGELAGFWLRSLEGGMSVNKG